MDEYGGPRAPPRPPKPAARVHRPAGARQPTVSLLQPRPEVERERNAYVEAPCRTHAAPPGSHAAAQPLKPVTTQPVAANKRRAALANTSESIVCERCGRCRCEQCARPRPLPSRWLCDNTCLCSAESCVDYVSCMCCVKAVLYHCASEEEEETREPCACGPRLAYVGAMAVPLPCLVLYWPLRAVVAASAALYSRLSRAGCRCPESPPLGLSSII